MTNHIIIWDIETIPDLQGFAAANYDLRVLIRRCRIKAALKSIMASFFLLYSSPFRIFVVDFFRLRMNFSVSVSLMRTSGGG
jgi:hypothetical protein